MANLGIAPRKHSGFSLVELMVALTIGLLLLGGLTMIFANSSEANRELQKTTQQIENGRYAIDTIEQDLRLAGFYGQLHELPAAPATAPDPCEAASAANLYDGLAYPTQGYRAPDMATIPDVTATTCDDLGFLVAANMQPGSDVLVVRRASTAVVPATGSTVTNDVYIQATGTQGEIQFGNGAVLGTNKANGSASTLFLVDGTPAPVRKYEVHVYFVAPCSFGSGTGGVCQAGDDAIPTLKRLELVSDGATTQINLVPLVEGVQYLKIEYGIDNSPSSANAATGLTGDATVDSYVTAPADWTQVIAAKVYVLAQNTDQTSGFTDDKSYTLGTATVAAANDHYKRHVYTTEIRLMNPAGRREIP